MRKAMLLLAVFGLVGSLWAADPIIGAWKLNIAKSKISPIYLAMLKHAAPKERMEFYREIEGDQIEFTAKEIRTDGASSGGSSKRTWPRQGGIAKRQPPDPEGISYVETLIAPGDWYVTYMQNGKQLGLIHKIISKDRKTMTQPRNGVDAQGKPFEHIEVYDRQ